jgi:hypothetical protein
MQTTTLTADLTINEVADLCGGNERRMIKVAKEIGADKLIRLDSWYEAAWAIARSFRGVENAKSLLHSIVWAADAQD